MIKQLSFQLVIDELEELYEQFHLKGLDGNAKKMLADRKQAKGKGAKPTRGRTNKRKEMSFTSSSEEEGMRPKTVTKPRTTKKRSNKPKKQLDITFSSDSE